MFYDGLPIPPLPLSDPTPIGLEGQFLFVLLLYFLLIATVYLFSRFAKS